MGVFVPKPSRPAPQSVSKPKEPRTGGFLQKDPEPCGYSGCTTRKPGIHYVPSGDGGVVRGCTDEHADWARMLKNPGKSGWIDKNRPPPPELGATPEAVAAYPLSVFEE